MTRPPLVLIPQHFGSLVFDRRTSRYLPFDAEATALLRRLAWHGIDAVVATIPDPDERDAVLAFIDAFDQRGFFTPHGRLAAQLLPVDDVPADHLVGPLAVHLEIIGACNLTCTHCFAGTLPRNQHPLTVAEMARLFGELAALGSYRLGLTGGEPLLRKDLLEILDAATDAGLHPCLTTNGVLLTEEIARALGRRPLVWLNVSLEGPDAATNDAVRGAGTFDAVMAKLPLLARHARFTLAFTVMRGNADRVRECAALAAAVGAHTAVFRPLYPTGVALDHPELMPTFDQYSGALRELGCLHGESADLRALDPFSPELRALAEPEVHTSHTCGAGEHVCSISVQGDVNPCSFLGPAFNTGNVRDTPFATIWRTGQAMRRLRQPASDGGFDGGCRARSLALAGSIDAPDPWMAAFRTGAGPHPAANVEVRAVPLPMRSSS
ncbi:MAG: radical SAM protein [Gemmataceae bacterium]